MIELIVYLFSWWFVGGLIGAVVGAIPTYPRTRREWWGGVGSGALLVGALFFYIGVIILCMGFLWFLITTGGRPA